MILVREEVGWVEEEEPAPAVLSRETHWLSGRDGSGAGAEPTPRIHAAPYR